MALNGLLLVLENLQHASLHHSTMEKLQRETKILFNSKEEVTTQDKLPKH